jgi:hypothetical protein
MTCWSKLCCRDFLMLKTGLCDSRCFKGIFTPEVRGDVLSQKIC